MPTTRQEKEFSEEMNAYTEVNTQALRAAIEWITNNCDPEDVFSERKLFNWAAGFTPDKLCSENELSAWAESNGYIKE